MNLRNVLIAGVMVLASASAAMADGVFSGYNAQLNTPAAKAKLLASTCANANGANLALCDKWKKDGVPNSDVRIGVVAGAGVVGAGAGFVAAAVPIGALGGKTLLAQWGVTSIAGWAPTVAATGATGAILGTGVGLGSYLFR